MADLIQDSNSNCNARFDSVFDSDANSRFAGPFLKCQRQKCGHWTV